MSKYREFMRVGGSCDVIYHPKTEAVLPPKNHKGIVFIRNDTVGRCIAWGWGMKIRSRNWLMTLTLDDLKRLVEENKPEEGRLRATGLRHGAPPGYAPEPFFEYKINFVPDREEQLRAGERDYPKEE